MSHYDDMQDTQIEYKQGGETGNKRLFVLYEQIDLLRLKASQTINPMVKAKLAEQAIGLSLELTKGLLDKVEQLEKRL